MPECVGADGPGSGHTTIWKDFPASVFRGGHSVRQDRSDVDAIVCPGQADRDEQLGLARAIDGAGARAGDGLGEGRRITSDRRDDPLLHRWLLNARLAPGRGRLPGARSD